MTIDEIVIGTEISGHFDLALKAIMQNVLPCGRFSLFDVVDFFKLLRVNQVNVFMKLSEESYKSFNR